ncbi:Uu.00g115520.m01.CDS01 [Anthostomella pinea]|uniref:Uu.00g115520.m01.CDS01 n=1 Tax=Anthostomella pinea TaxID=933095 RepID=A0AAI8VFW4_9PEZI|nr:Uu.00g115520.m01.CDS01 [Anthostomella pinea]
MASKTDFQIASLAFGFTLGFGFLTVWEAIKQTRMNKSPLRSPFIYMIWGEIAANLFICIIAWIFLDGILGATVPVLFVILALWVLEIQLLMQMIINRIAVIAESQKLVQKIKWGTCGGISFINCLVFIIFIPAHLTPPPIPVLFHINKYWDPTSKVLICIVDAGLNWYFLSTVKQRLVKECGLVKYAPLVSFNARLMVVSIGMDLLLIGLMWLPNEIVFIQFHPVVYMVKLNIEMSMASLITRLARGQVGDDVQRDPYSYSNKGRQGHSDHTHRSRQARDIALKSFNRATVKAQHRDSGSDRSTHLEDGINGMTKTVDYKVSVQRHGQPSGSEKKNHMFETEDDAPLTSNAGHP